MDDVRWAHLAFLQKQMKQALGILNDIWMLLQDDFDSLIRLASTADIVQILQQHPLDIQVKSLLLMAASDASKVLQSFELDMQKTLCTKMVRIKNIPSQEAQTIIQSIRKALQTPLTDHSISLNGHRRTSKLIALMPDWVSIPLLSNLTDHDPNLEDSLRHGHVQFEDLIYLAPQDLQRLFSSFDQEMIIEALQHADINISTTLLRAFSAERRERIQSELQELPKCSAHHGKIAQHKLVLRFFELDLFEYLDTEAWARDDRLS